MLTFWNNVHGKRRACTLKSLTFPPVSTLPSNPLPCPCCSGWLVANTASLTSPCDLAPSLPRKLYFRALSGLFHTCFFFLHSLSIPHVFGAIVSMAVVMTGGFNGCRGGGAQDRERSRETNRGNGACVDMVSALDSTPPDVSVSHKALLSCCGLVIVI